MLDSQELRRLIRSDDHTSFTSYIDTNPDVIHKVFDEDTNWPFTLLQLAVTESKPSLAQLLLDRGANPLNQPQNIIRSLVTTNSYSDSPSKSLLRSFVEKGVKFPTDDKDSCSQFIKRDLQHVYTYNHADFLQEMIKLGFDPIKTEEKAEQSILGAALESCGYSSTPKLAKMLLKAGCSLKKLPRDYYSPLQHALSKQQYKFVSELLKKGVDLTEYNGSMLHDLSSSHLEISEKLLDQLISDDLDFNEEDSYCSTPLGQAVYSNNLTLIRYLIQKGANIDALNSDGLSALFLAIETNQKDSINLLIDLNADLNLLNKKNETPLDLAKTKPGFKRMCGVMVKAGAKTNIELSGNGSEAENTIAILKKSIEPGEPWADEACRILCDLDDDKIKPWTTLVRHCLDNNSTKPSKKWEKEANSLVDSIGEASYRDSILQLLPLVKEDRTSKIELEDYYHPDYFNYNHVISENNTRLLKGLIWVSSRYNDTDVSRELRKLAAAMYKKVYGIGMRNAKLGNAAIYSLSVMSETKGLKEIIVLRAATKYNPALVNINRVFDKLAESRGMTPDQLAELSTPDYGLTDIGMYTEELGGFTALLRLTGVGKCELTWATPNKTQKSIPAAVKCEYAAEIKSIKAISKDIQSGSSAHSQRIEQMFLRRKPLDVATWKEQYINHKLIGFLARRLIWRVSSGTTTHNVIHSDNGHLTSENEIIEIPDNAAIVLWHPTMSSASDVLQWRRWLIGNEVTQPFKQAHREIYLLTDAEKETKNYSMRFANHILKHHQFNALATQRGWQQTRGGGWDGGSENSAYKKIPDHSINIEFEAQGVESYDYSDSGIYECVATSEVVFSKESRLNLDKIEPLVFSEVMRDVDLFVGVASIGNDPDWRERESTYWQDFSFGVLNATAETRKEVLVALIPKLKIASQLSLEGRFLVVKGSVRTYKIHLGSTNILMEPDDSYLCIVEVKQKNTVLLPFEGDRALSQILSKAMLLANDTKIKDQTILSQIKYRETST